MTQIEKYSLHFMLCVSSVLLLLFSTLNINNYLEITRNKNVLGSETQINSQTISLEERNFWQEFLEKNPDYIPGWIEIGRLDKVREIDPNYIRP